MSIILSIFDRFRRRRDPRRAFDGRRAHGAQLRHPFWSSQRLRTRDRERAADDRAEDKEDDENSDNGEDEHFADLEIVGLGHAHKGFIFGRDFGRLEDGELHVDDLDLIAASSFEADGRTDERRQLFELRIQARFVNLFAVLTCDVQAIDQHRHRQPLDDAGLTDLGRVGLGDLEIDGFLCPGIVGDTARPARLLRRRGLRKVDSDRDGDLTFSVERR